MNDIFKVNYIERKNYKKYLFSDEQKELIKNLYQNGNSTESIGELFGVSYKTITRVLDKLNVPLIGVGKRQYGLNENYFDYIDTQNKAYILGFLYADGCNCSKKSTISMSLEEGDKEILEKIRIEVGSEKELEFLDYSNKHDFGYTYKNQYRLLLFSAHMCKTLEKHGMTPNKSLTLSFPDISENLLPHFIRGIFDGDGSIYKHKDNGYTLTITSTNDFCMSLKNIVEEKLNIHCSIYDAQNHNGITKVFTISGRIQTKKFLDWIYIDAELFLKRKYNRYVQYYFIDLNINNSLPV